MNFSAVMWPIPKWGSGKLGGIGCKSLLTGGDIRTNTKNMTSGKKRLSNWGGKLIHYLLLFARGPRRKV